MACDVGSPTNRPSTALTVASRRTRTVRRFRCARVPGRTLNICSKRARLGEFYQHDSRVAPWTGTAHGVLQSVNTYPQHEGVVRGDRAERNSLRTITGEFADVDPKTWRALKPVLAAA